MEAISGQMTDGEYHLDRDRRHIVDLILRRSVQGPFSTTSEDFIEAKRTLAELPLDRVAKAYCAALRYDPNSLTIATGRGLQPQALEYATALFSGRRTRINLWTVEHLLHGRHPTCVENTEPGPERATLYTIESWELWQFTTFTAERLAFSEHLDTGGSSEPCRLDAGNEYVLSLYCSFSSKVDPNNIRICFPDNPNFKEKARFVSGNQAAIDINIVAPDSGEPLEFFNVSMECGTRNQTYFAHLPKLIFVKTEGILPPLRGEVADDWGRRLLQPDGPKLLFVRGEAGVGKTFFCENLSSRLRLAGGHEPFHFAVDGLDVHLFRRIFIALTLPKRLHPRSLGAAQNEIAFTLLRAMAAGGGGGDDHDAATIEALPSEIFAEVAARYIATNAKRVCLVLTNCQRMSSDMLRAFRNFLVALETSGWSCIRVICEFRDTKDEQNPDLEQFAAEFIRDRIGKADQLRLLPATVVELRQGLARKFSVEDARWISKELITKTQGNFLFVESILRHFINNGTIISDVSGGVARLILGDIAYLKDELRQVPASINQILRHRLTHLDGSLQSVSSIPDLCRRFLGLAALMGLEVDRRVALAFGLADGEANKLFLALKKENILTRRLGDGDYSFSHDLLRIAARERFVDCPTTDEDCQALLNVIDGSSARNCYLQGTILAFNGRDAEAIEAFSAGFEMAHQEPQDFLMQRRCLMAMDDVLSRQEALEGRHLLQHVTVLSRLAWAEHNAGSSTRATNVYNRALELLTHSYFDADILTPDAIARERSRLHQALFSEAVYCMRPEEAAHNAIQAFGGVGDFTLWGRLMNRSILLCHIAGASEHGEAAANLAIRNACYSEDPEVGAVLCTDIGDLYQLSNPSFTFDLRELGRRIAVLGRQRVHNDLCTVISEIYAKGTFNQTLLGQVEENVRRHAVFQVGSRIALAKGWNAFVNKDPSLARSQFTHALQQSKAREHPLVSAMAENNLMLLSLREGDTELVRRYAISLSAFCRQFERMARTASDKLPDLLDAATFRASLLPRQNFGLVTMPIPLPAGPPAVTSWVSAFCWNLRGIAQHTRDRRFSFDTRFMEGRAMDALSALVEGGPSYVMPHRGYNYMFALK